MAGARIVIGMLGAIGAGKSHVAREIARLAGGERVDADVLAREALATAAADGRLAAALGPGFVRGDGSPDREALAAQVFGNPELLRRLEGLTHPAVTTLIQECLGRHRRGEGPAVLVLDVPLLLEVGLDRSCDVLWYVDVPEALRLERLAERGLDPDAVRRREAHQTPLERKRARADLVIRNDVPADALTRQIREGLDTLGV